MKQFPEQPGLLHKEALSGNKIYSMSICTMTRQCTVRVAMSLEGAWPQRETSSRLLSDAWFENNGK